MVRNAGIRSIRDDVNWSAVERIKGHYQIPTQVDELVNEANVRGIDPLLVLGYGNSNYANGSKPHNQQTLAAYTDYASYVVNHFKGRVRHYEIWNEWDSEKLNPPAGDADSYFALIRHVYPVLKALDPDATFLVGSVTTKGIRTGYLKRVIELGLLTYSDGLSLHTYLQCRSGKSDAVHWKEWMEEIQQQLSNIIGTPQPFYITEIGWPTYIGKCGVSADEQASNLKNVYLMAKSLPYIRGIWWYDFQNDGNDQFNPKFNFGLINSDFSLKPSFDAMRSIAPQNPR